MDNVLLVITAAAAIAAAAIAWIRTKPEAGESPEERVAAEQRAAQALRDAVSPISDEVKRTGAAVEQIQRANGESFVLLRNEATESARRLRDEMGQQAAAQRTESAEASKTHREELARALAGQQQKMVESLEAVRSTVQSRLESLQSSNQQKLDELKASNQQKLDELKQENQKKLDEMRGVVDQKLNETLQTRLGEAFKQVSERLEQVHRELGTDLRKTLEGVKTRGVFGEVMLNGLLEEFLHPAQIERNFKPSRTGGETVEFAIRLPGREEDGADATVFLPIDAKFPKESYERMLLHLERGELADAEFERKQMVGAVLGFARDIRDKYVKPPRTTNFAVLYLPLESLFAEVLREPGLIEKLQSEYKVTLASPTTLAAYLNALQMGFRTLAVQKQSAELMKLLAVTRKQFQMFGGELGKVEAQLNAARNAIAATVKRTGTLDKRLRTIDAATEADVQAMLPPGADEAVADDDSDD
ncbi:MAG: DNA recombination protein RmuC [Planctomycetaceae bacterium]|nr:DNA recombination protein RmuC [Planctomycetaceae bacterium]